MAGTPDNDLSSDVALVRQVLARELETINEYESFARASTSPEVRDFFLHLASEEKEHVTEAIHMLRLLDTGLDALFSKPIAEGHFQGAIAGEKPPAAPPPAPPPEPAPMARGGRNGAAEPPALVSPQRVLYGVPAPPPNPDTPPLTVGSLRRSR
jgi:hypothetical protein